jgi:hypothetical protein
LVWFLVQLGPLVLLFWFLWRMMVLGKPFSISRQAIIMVCFYVGVPGYV